MCTTRSEDFVKVNGQKCNGLFNVGYKMVSITKAAMQGKPERVKTEIRQLLSSIHVYLQTGLYLFRTSLDVLLDT